MARAGRGRAPRLAAAVVCAALLAAAAGCGEAEPGPGAALPSIYVTAPLCAGAKRAFDADPRPGGEALSLVCLDRGAGGGGLAAIGAGARRASENAATVAYVGEPDRRSVDFSRPILEAAGIGSAAGNDGEAAMRRVLAAVGESAGSDDLRGTVRERLEAG